MASTIKQRLRRFNGTDYDSIYLSANVGDVTGTLAIANGGTGSTTAAAARTALGAAASDHTHSGYAASSHNHAAGDINSGTLPVTRGGTGIATSTYKNAVVVGNASTVTNALRTIRTASGAFYATAQDGAPSFGTLPAAQGGTGQTSLQATRNAMGLGDTTGVLPVANGGTGNSTVDTTPTSGSTKMCTSGGIYTALQNAGGGESTASLSGTVSAGNTVTWAGYTWLVMHVEGNYAYLIHNTIIENIQWASTNNGFLGYFGSLACMRCIKFQEQLSSTYLNCISPVMGAKVWLPSYDMLNSYFTYMTTAASRIANLNGSAANWWTSSPYSSNDVWSVDSFGYFGGINPGLSYGFRPAVKVKYK